MLLPSMRWFFIVLQYFGVQFLGFCLLLFAIIYVTRQTPSGTWLIALAIVPSISFLIVVTNPWHMLFYSYYDFYKDSFGILFLPVQTALYIYLIAGIVLLARGYLKQPGIAARPFLGRLMAGVTILPLLMNFYYLLFKFDFVNWIFPFPVFDVTPICIAIALILFVVPAIKFRFLDISTLSYSLVFENMPQGAALIDAGEKVVLANKSFRKCLQKYGEDINSLSLNQAVDYKKQAFFASWSLVFVKDLEPILKMETQLKTKNQKLKQNYSNLKILSEKSKELTTIKARREVSQKIHDLLGHTLTVAIGQSELILRENDLDTKYKLLIEIKELLQSSLNDLSANNVYKTNSSQPKEISGKKEVLPELLQSLQNDLVDLEIIVQGEPELLKTEAVEAIFGLCRESLTNSIRHGEAKKVHFILRYGSQSIEIYVIDDGTGCKEINKNHGLSGIEKRISDSGGYVEFRSDGEKGFFTFASIPLAREGSLL